VDRVEVIAAGLYIVVFVGVVLVDVIGGSAAALAATAAYMVLRLPALEVLGTGKYAGLIVIRMFSYLAFGLIGGLSWKLLRERLDKLEAFDTIDDQTHLLNSRGLFEFLDHEMARGRRYEDGFALCTVSFPSGPFLALKGSKRRKAMRVLGDRARDAVRGVDRIGIVSDEKRITVAVVCPQTDSAGAVLVNARLADSLLDALLATGIGLDRKVDSRSLVFPQETVEMGAFRDDLTLRTSRQFPDARK
jgi:hypothetical protein